MKNREALKTCALLSQFLNLLQDEITDLLANGVVTSGIVIGSILFACDELLRVEELAVGASANLINDSVPSLQTLLWARACQHLSH